MDSHVLVDDRQPIASRFKMPRVVRIVVVGQPRHVTPHGNNRQDVFSVDDDRRVFVNLLRDHS